VVVCIAVAVVVVVLAEYVAELKPAAKASPTTTTNITAKASVFIQILDGDVQVP
jgi:hypothetical protein